MYIFQVLTENIHDGKKKIGLWNYQAYRKIEDSQGLKGLIKFSERGMLMLTISTLLLSI